MVYFLTTEFFARLFSLNLQWIVDFILNNILWVFAFAACGYFFYPNKKLFYGFLFITFMNWSILDFTKAVGWVVLDPGYFSITIMAMFAVLFFAEADENLRKNLVFINSLRFIIVLIVFNLFLR